MLVPVTQELSNTGRRLTLGSVRVQGAAITAVALWSLKPIFVSAIGDRGDYAEVYIAAAAIAVATSIMIALLMRKQTMALLRGGIVFWRGAGWSSLSGLFLAMWYYGFYRALYGASKVDATIIAFTWPLIAVIVIPFLSPGTAAKLRGQQWLLILLSFAGAVAIAAADWDSDTVGYGGESEIVWAFVAALGSGLYLPFAINAAKTFGVVIESKPAATFFSISIANIAALATVLAAITVSGHALQFGGFDQQVWVLCTLIGIGTYLVAEIAWTWAFREYQSLTLSSLPYFSPAVSVTLLYLIFSEPISVIAIVGLILILGSNLLLHWRKNSETAPYGESSKSTDERALL